MADRGIREWMAQPDVSRAIPYGVAIAAVTGALLLELLFTYFHLPHAFAAFALSAIAITFWYGGTKPGIVAVLLAIMIRSYLFEAEISAVSRVLYDLVFVIFAVLMSWLKRRRSELEEKVAERTAELTQTNEELKNEIVERKKADEKLRRSEAYLLEGQRLVHMFSWAHDAATGRVTSSPEVRRIFGAASEEDISTTEFFLGRIHPEDRPGAEREFAQAALAKASYESDYRIILPDGSIKNIHTIGHPVLNESGDIVEFVGTAMDVTEQRRARAELETAFEEIKKLKDQLHDENVALREQIDQAFMFEEIVGSSPALQTVLSNILKVAPTDSTVLITGETGTGKELIARAIHKRSQRSGRAFIGVNSGTIFLDEVGELPAETQIALLRVLQEHQFERVGGTRVLPTDVRVIAATNRDLRAAIVAGTFRADLFYRLNVFPIEVPALRQRKEDIPMLVEYFVKRYAEKAGKQIYKIDKNTMELCLAYLWPGNIRELQNIIERSVILCSGDTLWIDEAWLTTEVQPSHPELSAPLTETLQNQEKEIIEAALAVCGGRIAGPNGAAAKLGIPRSTLDSKIKQLKIRKHKYIPEPQ
jgi:DNA-binding NtrC family response regulator/PAS domain-containing protein